MPQLQDPNFRRTVLLLVHHDEQSSFGLVLNRPAEIQVADLFRGLQIEWRGDASLGVSWGGPVELNSGWMLFGDAPAAVEHADEVSQVVDGLHFAGSLDVFRTVAEHPPAGVRFFLGYSGWGPGQLEFEIARGAWLSAPLRASVVFEVPPESMWDHVVRGLGIDPSSLVSVSGVH